jgi:hypothetical protein
MDGGHRPLKLIASAGFHNRTPEQMKVMLTMRAQMLRLDRQDPSGSACRSLSCTNRFIGASLGTGLD